jgi:hypothetical protein
VWRERENYFVSLFCEVGMSRLSLTFVAIGLAAMIAGCKGGFTVESEFLYPKGLDPRQEIYGPGYKDKTVLREQSRGFAPIENVNK